MVSKDVRGGNSKERSNSGLFSFFRWFKRTKSDDRDETGFATLDRSCSSSTASIATVNSFWFVPPANYEEGRPRPLRRRHLVAETDTYRSRIRQRDRRRETEKNISLRRKYRLYGSDSTLSDLVNGPTSGSVPDVVVPSLGRKKRKAPEPPVNYSLPTTLEHRVELGTLPGTHHRRTVSDGCAERRILVHVRGKRRAPTPPVQTPVNSPASTTGRKKRPAPQPPNQATQDRIPEETEEKERLEKERLENERIEQEIAEKERLDRLKKIELVREKLERERLERVKLEQERLEKGRLELERLEKERLEQVEHNRLEEERLERERIETERLEGEKVEKERLEQERLERDRRVQERLEKERLETEKAEKERLQNEKRERERLERLKKQEDKEHGLTSEEKQRLMSNICKLQAHAASVRDAKATSPVSPRPWYKRSSVHKDSGGFKDLFKKEKEEEWMPESGIPRAFNIFARLKDGEKRRSQVLMLANISELDREAAEIVQEQHAREAARQAAHHASFYAPESASTADVVEQTTKVVVNSSFFSKDTGGFFSRDALEKRFSFFSERSKSSDDERFKRMSHSKVGSCSPEATPSSNGSRFKRQSSIPPIVETTSSTTMGFTSSAKMNVEVNSTTTPKRQAAPPVVDPALSSAESVIATTSVTVTTSVSALTSVTSPTPLISSGTQVTSTSKMASTPVPATPVKTTTPSEVASTSTTSSATSNVETTSVITSSAMSPTNRTGTTVQNSNVINGFSPSSVVAPEPLQAAKRLTIWTCPRCTLENPRWRFICDACSMWRPAEKKEKAGQVDGTTGESQGKQKTEGETTTIDWENEIKKYFPHQQTKAAAQNGGIGKTQESKPELINGTVPKPLTQNSEPAAKPSPFPQALPGSSSNIGAHREQKISASKCSEPLPKPSSFSQLNPAPSSFIGGRLKQDEAKASKVSSSNQKRGNMLGGKEESAEKPDVQEVRKARLDFFRKSGCFDVGDEPEPSTEGPQTKTGARSDPFEDERLKLREMLKEMKNSLPKRPKPKAGGHQINGRHTGKEHTGAIKKHTEGDREVEKPTRAEYPKAGSVEEDPKMKRGPVKVSSAAQTSTAVVRRPEPPVGTKPSSSSSVKTPTIHDGVLYTSLRRRTFQLMHAGDFATIEATKTGSERQASHLYVNIPNRTPASSQNAAPKLERKSSSSFSESADFATPESSRISVSGVSPSPSPVSAPAMSSATASSSVTGSRSSTPSSSRSSRSSASSTPASSRVGGSGTSSASSSPSKSNGDRPSSSASSSRSGPSLSRTESSDGASESGSLSVVSECSEVDRLTEQLSAPEGIADFKAALGRAGDANTLAVNRLLRRLEASIAGGKHQEAASLARDLARLKISCHVTRQQRHANVIMVDMYVEDKVSHQGPIPLQVRPSMTVGDLRTKVAREFEVPERVQRWILGKQLANDDSRTLQEHQITESGCPVFLYLVAPEPDAEVGEDRDAESPSGVFHRQELPPRPEEPPRPDARGGWYYNYEEDRYSFCEDSESDLSDELEHEPQPNIVTPQAVENGQAAAGTTLLPVPKQVPVNEGIAGSSGTREPVQTRTGSAAGTRAGTPGAGMSGTATGPGPSTSATASGIGLTSNGIPADAGSRPIAVATGATAEVGPRKIETAAGSTTGVGAGPRTTVFAAGAATGTAAGAGPKSTTVATGASNGAITGIAVGPGARTAATATGALMGTAVGAGTKTTTATTGATNGVVTGIGAGPGARTTVTAAGAPTGTTSGAGPRTVGPTVGAGPRLTETATGSVTGTAAVVPPSTNAISALAGPRAPPRSPPRSVTGAVASTSAGKVAATGSDLVAEVKAAASSPAGSSGDNAAEEIGWRCPVCTLVNDPERPGCAACATERPKKDGEKQYQLLVDLDKQDLVPTLEPFDCPVCLAGYKSGEGVVLRECLHTFCRTCLVHTVQFSEEAEVKCPYRDNQYACDGVLQEREIKALVPPAMYEHHLAKSMTLAENKIGNAFHCKTPDCHGWCIFEDNVNEFRCPVCNAVNCLTCQAIHSGANCAQYQARVQAEADSNEDARRTRAMLQDMVTKGEAMSCPSCQVVLMKKWGCDWLRCSMCKTEICWVTRKPRWGPGGKGDTTGGCQCGLNGVKCHPKCNYCH